VYYREGQDEFRVRLHPAGRTATLALRVLTMRRWTKGWVPVWCHELVTLNLKKYHSPGFLQGPNPLKPCVCRE